MSEKPLFLDTNITFEKRAAAFPRRLREEADEWPTEILSYAYNQLPFLEKYATDIEIRHVEASRGYGIGVLMAFPMGFRKEAAHREGRFVTFPLIVRDSQLAPIDVFEHRGRYHGVEEGKVKTALGTPDLLMGVPPSQNVVTNVAKQIRPPDEHFGETFAGAGISKTSSFRAMLPWVTTHEVEKLAAKMMGSPGLQHSFLTNPVFQPALAALAVREVEKVASASLDHTVITASVLTVHAVGGGYKVKTAHHHGYSPTESLLSHAELVKSGILSPEELEKVAHGEAVVLVRDPLDAPEMVKQASAATGFGVYDVEIKGHPVRGIVVPDVRRLDGSPLETSLFTDGNVHATQEKIAGVLVGNLNVPADDDPRGQGVFLYQNGDTTWATETLNVLGHTKTASGAQEILARRGAYGDQVRVSRVAGVQGPTKVANHQYVLPAEAKWVTLGERFVQVDAPEIQNHQRIKLAASNAETLHYNGTYWFGAANQPLLRGHSYDDPNDLYLPLGAMGLSKEAADHAIHTARAGAHSAAPLLHTRRLVPLEEVHESIIKQANVHRCPVKQVDLIKELAVLASPAKTKTAALRSETADEILALHLLTPENAAAYVDFLPALEKAASNMAEILVASRLGMEDVRESAARNALEDMTEVIKGLEVLKAKLS